MHTCACILLLQAYPTITLTRLCLCICSEACVGTGAQLATLCLAVILLTIAGSYFEERGTILTAFIVCYALTSFVGGYVSGAWAAGVAG